MNYIQVLLPLSLNWIPTFSTHQSLERGQFVTVSFNRKNYLGIVWKTEVVPDINTSKIREIVSIQTDIQNVSNEEIALWEFISAYYLCPVSEVFRIAYPSFRSKGELSKAARIEKLHSRIEGLQNRIDERNSSTSKRLSSSVSQKLQAQKTELEAQLQRLCTKSNRIIQEQRKATLKNKPVLVTGHFLNRIELYIKEIHSVLDCGGQVLLLCPDLNFASRLEQILKPQFSQYIHSASFKTSNSQRYHIATELREFQAALVIGTKNAIFLPFTNLDLIIIDEEQDSAYKNNENSPRFNARDCGVYLATIHNSKIILGASVPSLESYNNIKESKYEAIKLLDTQHNTNFQVVDILDQRKKNAMVGSFSAILIEAIDSCKGTIVLIKTWEKSEEIANFIDRRFAGKDIKILSLAEFKRSIWLRPSLIAVLQADGLLSKEDFRADEKALQITAVLGDFTSKLIIQTSVPSRFDGSRSLDVLLEERKKFNFPPFTRMVDLCDRLSSSVISQRFFARNSALNAEKQALVTQFSSPNTYFDVDPLI